MCGRVPCVKVDKRIPRDEPREPTNSSAPSKGGTDTTTGEDDGSRPVCDPATLRVSTPVGQGWGKVTTPAKPCPEPDGRGAPRISALELSRSASARLPLPAPAVRTAPPRGSTMLIRIPTWFWLDPQQ